MFCFLSGKCDVPLGLEDGRIPNPMFRASSSYNFYCAARNARLHQRRAGRNGGAWCSRARNNKQWLQVDFGTDTVVTRVSTQGRHNSDQWVTSYYVSFSSRGQRFITYKEGRRTKVLKSLAVHLVGNYIIGRFLRLRLGWPIFFWGGLFLEGLIFGTLRYWWLGRELYPA